MNPNPNLNGKGRQDFKKRQERFPWKKNKKNMSSIRLEIPPNYSAIFYTVRQLRHPVYIPPYISKEITCFGSEWGKFFLERESIAHRRRKV